MRKSRATAAIGLSVVTGLALSACAGGASDGTVTLQMVESLTNPARTEVLKSLIADFEADNPKIKVELISPPTDQADQKIQQMLQSGKGVDVLEVTQAVAHANDEHNSGLCFGAEHAGRRRARRLRGQVVGGRSVAGQPIARV